MDWKRSIIVRKPSALRGSDVTLVRAQCAWAADMRAICARGSYESVQLKWRLEVTVLALLVATAITSATITAQRLVVSTLVPAVIKNLMIVLDARLYFSKVS